MSGTAEVRRGARIDTSGPERDGWNYAELGRNRTVMGGDCLFIPGCPQMGSVADQSGHKAKPPGVLTGPSGASRVTKVTRVNRPGGGGISASGA
ncbi:hypothetical protein GCM10020254_65530 [Streptomyces goshikiensis]